MDTDRFIGRKRAVCTIPYFNILGVRYGHDIPERVDKPANFDEMIRIAS